MKIKSKPEDFYVKEIIDLDKKKEGETFRYFLMRKKNISTIKAIKIIARKLHISKRKIYFAGEKDKNTISEQYIAIRNLNEFKEEYNFGNVYLKYVGSYDEPLRISDIEYNYFRIIIREVNEKERELFEKNIKIFDKYYFNYFDEQRFGNRYNNHIIGKYIIKRDFENAIKIFLTDYNNEKNELSIKARKYLLENWGNFKEALKLYPSFLDIERSLLTYLSKEINYRRALRYIPKRILKMFVHSYQSYLWNKLVSRYIEKNYGDKYYIETKIGKFYIIKDKEEIDKLKNKIFPLIGYDIKDKEIYKEILGEENINIEELEFKDKPSLSLLSTNRNLLSEVKELDYKINNDIIEISFILNKGSFATMYIKHLFSNF
ncbi:MAG: tRNA pseudouridine(13) synthase TruD [Nanopusillaceae archaeon]